MSHSFRSPFSPRGSLGTPVMVASRSAWPPPNAAVPEESAPVVPPPRDGPVTQHEVYAPIELDPKITKELEPVRYEGSSPLEGRVNRIKDWEKWSMARRIRFLRDFVEDTARDPAIAAKAVRIIREARAPLRNHRAEWAALLKWVQTHVRFTAEPNERIQSPQYTLSTLMGDCDDCATLLAALAHSIRLPFRFVVSGRANGERTRWIEGVGLPIRGATWTHIYVLAQWPPFRPRHAAWAEPTLDVPLGFDSMKDRIPRGRADIGQAESAVATTKSEAMLNKVVRQLPWMTILGTVVGSMLSFFIVQGVIAPRFHKSRRQYS